LQSIAGNKLAFCVVYVVASGATNTSNGSNTFVSLYNATDKTGDIDVLNPQSQKILVAGYNGLNSQYFKTHALLLSGLSNVKYLTDNNLYVIPFSNDIHGAIYEGTMNSFLFINDSELYQVQIDTPVGFTSGNYDVFVDCYVYRHLFVCNGQFKVQN
jgi:hypothetical protein